MAKPPHRILICDDALVCRAHAMHVLKQVAGTHPLEAHNKYRILLYTSVFDCGISDANIIWWWQMVDTKSGEQTLEVWDANEADADARPFSLIIMVSPLTLSPPCRLVRWKEGAWVGQHCDRSPALKSSLNCVLVFQDNQLGLKVMDGCQCIKELRARGFTNQILMLTGAKIEKEDSATYKAAG